MNTAKVADTVTIYISLEDVYIFAFVLCKTKYQNIRIFFISVVTLMILGYFQSL